MPPIDTSLSHILLNCLRPAGTVPLQLSLAEWNSLARLAQVQHVAPLLHYHLKEKNATEYVPEHIQQAIYHQFQKITARNLTLQVELHRIVSALKAAYISVVALKGIHLASVVYPAIGMRQMGD